MSAAVYVDQDTTVAALNDFKTTMNKMKKTGGYDTWLSSLFKSIFILDLSNDISMTILLSVMPIEILFNPDPNESHLKVIELSHDVPPDCTTIWTNCMNEFSQKYSQYEKNLEKRD